MKRVIRSSLKKYSPIYSGISLDSDKKCVFNWNADDAENDILFTNPDVSGEFDDDNVHYVYGYIYNPHADPQEIRTVRNILKGNSDPDFLLSDDLSEFIERSIGRLNHYCYLSDFGALLSIRSTNAVSLVTELGVHLGDTLKQPIKSFQLVKESYDHVEFDSDKATAALLAYGYDEDVVPMLIERTKKKFEKYKKSHELFQMKKFSPRPIRFAFSNFLKFRTEAEKQAYECLQGTNVLIYDDFLTSGATIKEVVRYLRAIHDENTLTVFVLVKQ